MTTNDSMLRRIAGLLAKAEATEFEAEREAFLLGARRLMADHAITEADLAAASANREEPGHDLWMFSADDRLLDAKRLLVAVACRIAGSGTTAIEIIGYPQPGHWCGIVGFPTEAAVARMAYPSVLAMAEAAADLSRATHHRIREKYMLGFGQALMDKLRDAERTEPGLVLATRAAEVGAAVAALEPSPAPEVDIDPDDAVFFAGYREGTRADLDIGGHAQRLTPG